MDRKAVLWYEKAMAGKLNMLREFSIPLLAGVASAILWANISPAGYEQFVHAPCLGPLSLHFLSNDIFMVFFFAIAAAEITQSCLPGGDLSPLRTAVSPLLATAGGVVGPIIVYLTLNGIFGSSPLTHGWGIPTATDIAFAWLTARLIFGARHPAISFLLLLAIADDAIGMAIIALFYPNPLLPPAPLWLILTLAGMIAALVLRTTGTRNYWPYLLCGGVPSWIGLHNAHLHPALALVFVVPFLPHPGRERKHLFEEDLSDRSTLARFEHEWKLFVDLGLFLFGFANAGVPFSAVGTATGLVFFALLVGKCGGIFAFSLMGKRLGFPLPRGMGKKELFTAGIVAGLGFTVALFVAGEAFTDKDLQGAAKMGAMFSFAIAPLAWGVARSIGIEKRR